MHAAVLPFVHAVGERYELPIPLWLFVVGGAAVVVFSFLLVLRRATAPLPADTPPDAVPLSPFPLIRGTLSIVVTMLIAVGGVLGSQDKDGNLAPLFFWIGLWVVVPMTAGLLGDWTRTVNPFANLARLGGSARLRKAVLNRTTPLAWTLGWWPAVAAFVALVLGELVFNVHTTTPAFVGWTLLLYGVACLFLGMLFGEGFQQRGEVLSGLWDAWGRLGFWRHGAPGSRGFAGGLDVPFDPSPSRVVFVLLMLISINFDGLLSTPKWASYENRVLSAHSVSVDSGRECLAGGCYGFRTLSLVVLVLVVLGVFAAFAFASARAGRFGTGPMVSLAQLLPSLVPIAFGYLIAHYLQYVVINGQRVLTLLGNPVGKAGWPIHPPYPFSWEAAGDEIEGGYHVHIKALPNSAYWYVSVVVIVAVHVVAVVLANRRLAGRAETPSLARRSEYPWLIAMVAYTAFSLTLIAQPLTKGAGSSTSAESQQ